MSEQLRSDPEFPLLPVMLAPWNQAEWVEYLVAVQKGESVERVVELQRICNDAYQRGMEAKR